MLNVLQRFRGPAPRTQPAYENLVVRVADGEYIDESAITDVLDGREVEHFQADVKRLLDRRAAVADLERAKLLDIEQSKLEAGVREAKAAFDNHPLQKMMIELQALGQRYEQLRVEVQSRSASLIRSKAMHVLSTTASKDIFDRVAEISNETRGLQNQQQQFALSESEASEYRAAQNDVAELPGRIVSLKKQPGSAGDCASLTARLVAQRQAIKRFAARLAEAERIGKEIAKLNAKVDVAGAERMRPECMEFASKPKPRDL